jgi:hypothetical protein
MRAKDIYYRTDQTRKDLFIATQNWEQAVTVPAHVPVEIIHTEKRGRGLVATKNFCPGEKIFEFVGDIYHGSEFGDRAAELFTHSLQVGEDEFLISTEYHFDNFLNHSSTPNCWIEFGPNNEVWLVALQDIENGEELFFNYNSTEYNMVQQGCAFFDELAQQFVGGFIHLSVEEKLAILEHASPYIKKAFAKLRPENPSL